jgi:tetratricopeptide (TPR) repeat protein
MVTVMRRIFHAPYVFLPLVLCAVAHFFWAATDFTFGQTNASNKREKQSLSPGATDAQELFRRISPSVFVVEALDQSGSVTAIGSGVAVSASEIATNKHVVEHSKTLRIRWGEQSWRAITWSEDPEHDICVVEVEGLHARPVPLRFSHGLRIGERVYAVGAPEGLELTISEGLISGMRFPEGGRMIQTSAPISPGSSGGGLFDTQGRLVGITSLISKTGQNLNFAVPAEWILPLANDESIIRLYAAIVAPAGNHQIAASDLDLDSHQWFLLGDKAEKNKDYAEAAFAFHQAVALEPSNPENWIFLGQTLRDWDHLEDAIKAFTQAVQLKPNQKDDSAWLQLGKCYSDLKQYDEAIVAFKKALEIDSTDDISAIALGFAYEGLHEHELAIQTIGQIVKQHPCYHNALIALGMAYWLADRRTEAMQTFRKMAVCGPQNEKDWWYVGHLYQQNPGQYRNTIPAFENATIINPQDELAWWFLGYAYGRIGDRAKVSDVYEHLKLMNQKDASILFYMWLAPGPQ